MRGKWIFLLCLGGQDCRGTVVAPTVGATVQPVLVQVKLEGLRVELEGLCLWSEQELQLELRAELE